MKVHSLLVVCILSVVLLVPAGDSAAQSALPMQPNPALAAEVAFDRVFLAYSGNFSTKPWWYTSTKVDNSGGIHTVFYTDDDVFYAYCPNNCGSAAKWQKVKIGSGDGSLSNPSLALTSTGAPRVMWYGYYVYYYAERTASGAWNTTTIWPSPYDYANIYQYDTRYFALDNLDRPRFVTNNFNYPGGLTYVYCDGNCSTASNWYYTEVNLGGGLSAMQLAFNSSGQPRVIGINGTQLDYAQCDTNCKQANSWSKVKIADNINLTIPTSYSLRLDSAGRPRVAYYKMNVSDGNMYLTWSNTNFTSTSSWVNDHLPASFMEPASFRTLDLALDSLGRPHIVFASKDFDLRYIQCVSQCNTLQSEWDIQDLETGADLDGSNPIPPVGGAFASGWWIEGVPSLWLDKNDKPFVSYYLTHRQYIDTSAVPDVWAIRIASPDTRHRIYLPFNRR